MAKNYYYTAYEDVSNETLTIAERFETREAAVQYCEGKMREWCDEGYNAYLVYDEGRDVYDDQGTRRHVGPATAKVVGAEALDHECYVIHHIIIFETTYFMSL